MFRLLRSRLISFVVLNNFVCILYTTPDLPTTAAVAATSAAPCALLLLLCLLLFLLLLLLLLLCKVGSILNLRPTEPKSLQMLWVFSLPLKAIRDI